MKKYLKSDKEVVISEGTKGDQFGVYADVGKLNSIYPKRFMDFDEGLKQTIKEFCNEIIDCYPLL